MPTPEYPQPMFVDLGTLSYQAAYREQERHHDAVLASRESASPESGRILVVEHVPPVITVTRRPGAAGHLVASPHDLARAGVEVCETDRGGDITYHGPGQIVVYPIIDLNFHGLRLHDYMRLLESAVIATLSTFGVDGERDSSATGVWVRQSVNGDFELAKVCAMGVRVRRWISMHGLALNVTTNLEHFNLIVPCGLVGRRVTSLQALLGERCPSVPDVKRELVRQLTRAIENAHFARRLASGESA